MISTFKNDVSSTFWTYARYQGTTFQLAHLHVKANGDHVSAGSLGGRPLVDGVRNSAPIGPNGNATAVASLFSGGWGAEKQCSGW